MSTLPNAKEPSTLATISVKLSNTAAQVLLGCIDTLQRCAHSAGRDEILRGVLTSIKVEVRKSFGMENKDQEKANWVFLLTTLTYEAVIKTIVLAMEAEPGHPDNPFRDTLLKILRDAQPTTRETVPDASESSVARISNLNPAG